jgi:5-methylcytosine-specific restriction endonuclease McrA
MEMIYEIRYDLTKHTKILHEVHHIIPISKGGLHHPDNLIILTSKEHRKIHIEIKE